MVTDKEKNVCKLLLTYLLLLYSSTNNLLNKFAISKITTL